MLPAILIDALFMAVAELCMLPGVLVVVGLRVEVLKALAPRAAPPDALLADVAPKRTSVALLVEPDASPRSDSKLPSSALAPPIEQ